MLQGCINLGIAETPVHFGAVKVVAVHGEDHALHFICLSLVLEADFHTLTAQVGDKHVPVAASAYFRFQYVVQPVLRPVRCA